MSAVVIFIVACVAIAVLAGSAGACFVHQHRVRRHLHRLKTIPLDRSSSIRG